MNCPSCGKEIENNSKFCEFCGAKIEIIEEKVNKEIPAAKQKNRKMPLLSILLGALSLILAVAVVYLSFSYSQLKASSQNTEQVLNATQIELTRQKNTCAEYKTKLDAASRYSDYFSTIRNFSNYNHVGYASDNFKMDCPVILVKKHSTATVSLTAWWNSGGNVEYSFSDGTVAMIDFEKDSWSRSVNLNIYGLSEGVTIATFSNSHDMNQFYVLILVV